MSNSAENTTVPGDPVHPMVMLMWASMRDDGSFEDVHPSAMQVSMCGCKTPVPVQVTISENGTYWGWQENDETVCMIWPHFQALAMCFPYGIDVAETSGQGQRVKLQIVQA